MSRRDGNTIQNSLNNVDIKYNLVSQIASKIVTDCCYDLDELMQDIGFQLKEGSIDDISLESYILELANRLYFVSEQVEILGIKEDISKSIRSEIFNKIRDNSTGTKADKDSIAELYVKDETIVLNIYSRCYKTVKLKYDSGYEMLNSLKKIMNKRISEIELSNSRYIGGSKE